MVTARPTAKLVVAGTTELDASFILQKESNLLGRTDPHSNIFPEIDLSRFDPETKVFPPDAVSQCENCFRNIERALKEAGTSLENLVRVQIFLANEEDFARVAPIIRKHCYAARPTNTTVFARMVMPQMLVEIEATAKIAR